MKNTINSNITQQNYMKKTMKSKHKKENMSDSMVGVVSYVITGIFALFCLIPFIYLLSGSFSSESEVVRGNLSIIPKGFTMAAYQLVINGKQIFISYGVSIGLTVLGTIASLLFTSFFAYPLSTGRLRYGKQLNFFVYFTMIFNGGLVATYIWYTQGLHLSNSYLVLVLPTLMVPWNMFLLRNFYASIPASLAESARIDGAGESRILWQIILPCSKPALATVGTFYALAYWNEWYKVMLYNSGDKTKWTLQYLIMKMMREIETIKNMTGQGVSIVGSDLPSTTMKLATAVLTIGPIILAYPLAQKYFTSGIMVGSVKG